MIRKFVTWDVAPLETYANTDYYKMHSKLEAGEKPTREEKNRLVFSQESPVWRYMGYMYDFRGFLNKFWVETKYYGIMTFWAWDKTAIRKHSSHLQIIKIVEVES
jgi:hypothetical protein